MSSVTFQFPSGRTFTIEGTPVERITTPAEFRKRRDGWGDALSKKLESIGITPESYADAKELFGLPPTCGCKARKEWLNKVSDWWRATAP